MITIEKLDNKGRGIAYQDGVIVFIENALIDESVDFQILDSKKKYMEAKSTKITSPSSNRVMAKCPYYDFCGGCNIMHMTIESQANFKIKKVEEILEKYAGISEEIKFMSSDKDLFYRNKITLKVVDGELGFFNSSTHNLTKIDKCLIANNTINEFLSLWKIINFSNGEITIRTNYQSQLLISIYSRDTVKIDYGSIPSNIAGIVINNKTIYKNNYFYDYIDDLKFKVSYDSFFQINNYVASLIFKILRNNLKGKNLLDLYCGVGVLGLALKDKFKNIYGIEKVSNAISDAKINAKYNNVLNAHYYTGDTSKILKKINVKFDSVIVDPPRSGLNKDTIEKIMEINPKNICYISCDPMTLARDLKILSGNYKIDKIYALDMFPNTYHVECVCVLNRR